MPREADAHAVLRQTSAELRIGVWRRVSRGVAHDLLNAAMPLRSLAQPVHNGGDVEGRAQLARDTATRITSIGLALHRLEASIRDDNDEEEGSRWPLLREMIRWAVPRSVRIHHDEGANDLGAELTPASAALTFWTAVFCGEVLEPEGGEIALDRAPEGIVLQVSAASSDGSRGVAEEAQAALAALAEAGVIDIGPELAGGGRQITVRVTDQGPADLPRRARV